LGPVFAAFVIVPWGQLSLAWFAVVALLAMLLLTWIGSKQKQLRAEFTAMRAKGKSGHEATVFAPWTIVVGLVVLTLLMFTKNAYEGSFRSFYTFYLMEKFGLSIPSAQMTLFIFMLAAAVGVLIGGIAGDKIGRYRIIWISVLGPLPLSLRLCRKLFRFQLDGRCCRARLDVTGVRGGQNGDRIQRGALS
jgi:MFS transporter, FSR family, fosmidomycin resistance protein